jgi:hypothetical protein
MFALPELLFDGVYYLTPEHARPWRAADTKFSNSPVRKPYRLLKITCFVAIQRTEAYALAHRTSRAEL